VSQPNQFSIRRSQLRDHGWWLENRKAVEEAAKKGAIIDDISSKPSWRAGIPPAPAPPEPAAAPPIPAQRAGADFGAVGGRIQSRPGHPWIFRIG